jgi:hypothetical protein
MLPEHEEQQDFVENLPASSRKCYQDRSELQIQVSLEFSRMGPDGL